MITKSGYMKGLQCELAFYNWWNKIEESISESAEGRMNDGTEVGKLAQKLAPGGVDLDTLDLPIWTLAEKTKVLLESALPIYEATFITDIQPKLLCKVDILVPDKRGWQIWEVKATNSVKPEHIQDLAFQTFVLERCGIKITKIALVHLNKEYIRIGPLNIQKLFVVEDVIEEVRAVMVSIEEKLNQMYTNGMLSQAPHKNIGAHCNAPYACGYQDICWKTFPEKDNIYTIPRLGKKGDYYFDSGIYHLEDLDPNILTEKQRSVWDAHINKTIINNKEEIISFLNDSNYPQYFLDFETINPAIPIWDNTKPYQQIPFQYSLHIIRKPNAEPEHLEFLDDASGADPRPSLSYKLIQDLGNSGTIWTFNQSFESGRINELSILFPEYKKELGNILNRINDLITPFRNLWYYDPAMQGSSSIKKVLPVLVPELNYENLEIGDGATAMDMFLRLVKGDSELILKKEEIMFNLREYCKLDTWAMVKIRENLLNN
ncbi:MAG: DUF2779 domain-containing protein [Bacteroidetes bacterium]|nr:DUF2779 domain-containing protein [Bacteroidota bacterium]